MKNSKPNLIQHLFSFILLIEIAFGNHGSLKTCYDCAKMNNGYNYIC